MLASLLLLILPLSLGTTASPMSIRQTPSRPWCGDLGAGIFDIAYNFTLAAYNTSQPNANSTGAPLILGQDGAIQGYQFKVLSVRPSTP